jgi:hypothetical protein
VLHIEDISPDIVEFVIQGISKDGKAFRPSNWWERLSDMLSTTGKDGRIFYSSYVRPTVIQDVPSVVVRTSLKKADPHAFEMIKQFVTTNHLTVRTGRSRKEAGATGLFPTISMERRSHENNGW